MKIKNSHELYLLIAALVCCAIIIGYNALDSVPIYDSIELAEPVEISYSSTSSEITSSNETELENMESDLFIEPESIEEIYEEVIDESFYQAYYSDNEQMSEQPKSTQSKTTAVTTAKPKTTTVATTKPQGKVNINTATVSELETLPGIGPAKAQAIIEYRTQFGPFSSVEELINVSGIGEKTLEKIRNLCCV